MGAFGNRKPMHPTEMSFEQLCELFNYTPKGRPLDAKEAAALLGISTATMETHRVTGVGPRYFMPPGTRRVRYSERDLLAWLASGVRKSTSDQPGKSAAA